MNFKRIILLMVFFASVCGWAQSQRSSGFPEVLVDSVSFKQINKNDIGAIGGPLMRGEITLLVKNIPDKSKWVRNVEVELTVAFENKNATSDANRWLLLESRAKIFAAEYNKKTSVSFFIPWESYAIYRISREPDYYVVNLFVDNQEIPMTESNVKQRVSKNIKSMKELEAFKKAVASHATRNKGVLKPLNECAYNIQFFEYNTNRSTIPTYLDTK